MADSVLISRAEVEGHARQCVRIQDGVITDVGPGFRLIPGRNEVVLDAAGGAVIPGLHDHHVHLRATAAAQHSVRLGPPEVNDPITFATRLHGAAARAAGPNSWVRGIGYHERTAGELDRDRLDAIVQNRPVRIQHRTGSLWILNSRALAEVCADRHRLPGLERDKAGRLTGRLWRLDEWLGSLIPRASGDLARLSREAACMGITGFTDASPHRDGEDVEDFERLVASGAIMQRLMLMAPGSLTWPAGSLTRAGPTKFLLDDHDLPDVDDLAASIQAAHGQGRPVAVHCVTADQLVVLIAAFERAGSHAGDRIEHAAVVPPALAGDVRALGITIVTQPAFVAERGYDYLRDVARAEQSWLYPCASLLKAGVPVAASSDAPYGCLDPWIAMRSATQRRTFDGRVLNPSERVTATVALGLYLGPPSCPGRPRHIAPGEEADLCVLRTPLVEALRAPAKELVAATLVAGRIVFGGPDG